MKFCTYSLIDNWADPITVGPQLRAAYPSRGWES